MSSSRRSRVFLRIVLVSVFIGVVVVLDIASGGSLRDAVRSSGANLLSAVSFSDTKIGAWFSDRASLAREIARLEDENQALSSATFAHSALREENAYLREFLSLAERETGVAAPVLSSPWSSPYGTLIIGAGWHDGVADGDLVLDSGGFLVGVVNETGERRANITELFSFDESLDVLIGEHAAEVESVGGGNARARVSRDADIRVGDAVVAPRFSLRLVGLVGSVNVPEEQPYAEVLVRLPANLNTLRFVYIVRP